MIHKVFTIALLLFVARISHATAQDKLDHKYKEFDFWIGEWDVYKNGTDSIVGKSKIERIIDGKAIKESYHSTTSKYHGTSLNKYNPKTDQWEQFWVDNGGLTLHIKGNLENGKMILQNEVITKEETLSNKIKWQKNEDGTVRQTWYQSKDQGKTWTAVFDGKYRKKERSRS